MTFRVVIGLDATSGNVHSIRNLTFAIGPIFERVYSALKLNKLMVKLEMKIMLYRNYNSPAEKAI
jgi:hypothetical protein